MLAGIDKKEVVFTWMSFGLRDFYISFELEDANKWHAYSTFFCHQGLEKICKAYLIGTESVHYEKLERSKALEEINQIAKKHNHGLRELLESLQSRNVVSKIQISRKVDGYAGSELIQILDNAYLESRYPIPNPTYKKYPISTGKKSSRMYHVPIGETAPIKYARDLAGVVVKKIFADFSVPIKLSDRISNEDWIRFCRLFQFGSL